MHKCRHFLPLPLDHVFHSKCPTQMRLESLQIPTRSDATSSRLGGWKPTIAVTGLEPLSFVQVVPPAWIAHGKWTSKDHNLDYPKDD